MAQTKRAVFLKQSGESLMQADNLACWGKESIDNVVQSLEQVYENRAELGIEGITLVPGAGNIARGNSLREVGIDEYPDTVGRVGTIANTLVLAEALKRAKVPAEVFITSRMGFWDPNIQPSAYNTRLVREAHIGDKLVIIGGGAGKDHATTDYAVVFYARDYKTTDFEGEIIIIKGTKWDGIYENDPAESKKNGGATPRRYQKISAHTMREAYEQFKAVDKACLDQLIDGQLPMLVYQEDKHSLKDVLAHNPSQNTGAAVGTLIVPEVCEPVFYKN